MMPIARPSTWVCSRCLQALRPWSSLPRGSRLVRLYSAPSSPDSPDLSATRNIGIIAHIDAGKTTTTERMLYYSGFTRRIGDVDDGSTVTDFLPAERARGITIQSAAITFHWPPVAAGSTTSMTVDDLKAKGLPRSAKPHTINLIDTPGHADFTFEVLRSLRILDGAVCILDGVAGVEAQTEQVWNQASVYNIPRIIFVNKLDREGATFGRTVKEIGSKLGSWPAVSQIPWFDKEDFKGVGDVISLQGLLWQKGGDGKQISVLSLKTLQQTESQLANELKKARVALVELLSEHDEGMIECFLEHDEDHLAVPAIEIIESLRRCLLDPTTRVVPVFAGASFRNIGVQPLLDAVVNLLPSPTERPDPEVSIGPVTGGLQSFIDGKMAVIGREEKSVAKRAPKKKKKNISTGALQKMEGCALAFKVVSDAKRGILVYVRVYSGSLKRNAPLFNTNLDVFEKAPKMLKMYASDVVEIDSIPAGHIGVLVGLKHARTGDTLVSYTGNQQRPPEPLDELQLRPVVVPPPVFFAGVEPHSLAEEKNVQTALALLLREDPSLHVSQDEDSGQTLLSGMGELHLEIARDRLVNDFKAKASMGKIEIGYRECISGTSAPVTKIFDKEIAGRKGKAGCTVVVQTLSEAAARDDLDGDVLFSEEREGNRITIKAPGLDSDDGNGSSNRDLPSDLTVSGVVNALHNGCLAALARGPRHSFPIHSADVTLTFDITQHLFGNDTSTSALSAAARLATQSALKELEPTSSLMEPVMNVSITLNEASLGTVVHDISAARGGHILSLDDDGDSSSASGSLDGEDRPAIDVSRIYAPPDPWGAASSPTGGSAASTNSSWTITARVPLKEMVGYLKHLRSLTQGRGTFVMSVDKFEKMNMQRERAALAEMRGL